MAKTAAQRAARRRRRLNKRLSLKASVANAVSRPVANRQPKRKKKAKQKAKASARFSIPASSVSMVNDGVNVGSVWKNTTSETVTFPMAREKVSDLTSASTAFQLLKQYYVNPGNSSLFPIFSQIASCYEEYIPNHLKFIFRTEEYMASGSTVSAGLCAMGTNFDANDANFGNITQLENYEHSISGPPFSGIMIHDCVEQHQRRFRGKSRDIALNNYYVYNSANSIGPSTDQAKWYDLGNFQVAVNGCQAGLIGELWVEYSFTLIRRKQPEFPIGGQAIHLKGYADDATAASPLGLTPYTTMSATSTGVAVSGVAPGSTLSVINMAGDLSNYTSSTVGLNDATDTLFNLPNASALWLVNVEWGGATGIAAVPALAASGGAATVVDYFGSTGGAGYFLAAGNTAVMTKVISTTATAVPTTASNLVTVSGLTGMTDGNLDIFISRLPNALVTLTSPLTLPVVDDRISRLEEMFSNFMRSRDRFDHEDLPTPESKDMETSVHIPKSAFQKLLNLSSSSK
jgi:hypothetical protein